MASGIFTLKNQLLGLIQNVWSGTTSSNAPKYVEYLVVAGGGGGGTENSGGGGAGGLLQGLLPIVLGSSYTVTIGSGGAGVAGGGASNTTGGVGLNTTFGSITAIGGGGGGSRFSIPATVGGSGGGSGSAANIPQSVGASGIFGQGNAGGGYNPGSPVWGGGGGGGAGSAGASSISGICAGNGGAGIFSAISGTITAYAGGGGGGDRDTQIVGIGGIGGGGTGANDTLATSGSANSGGGGGGGGQATTGASGGSGIVIVRYSGNIRFFSGGILSYDSINNYTIHTFYASGTLAPLTTPITYGTTSTLTKSLRFRSSNSAVLTRAQSTTNRKTWTFSAWVKKSGAGSFQYLLNADNASDSWTAVRFQSQSFMLASASSGSYDNYVFSAGTYNDPSAWYHLVAVADTTNAIGADRYRLYVNGVRCVISLINTPVKDYNTFINYSAFNARIGSGNYNGTPGSFFDGNMTEVNFIDGQALTPQAFGQYDFTGGVWQPMAFVGTYGTNGFYLPFTNTTSTTTLGYDSSGNGNNWATSGFSLTAGSTYDSMNDVPTLTSATASNYPVMNPLSSSTVTLTNGNLSISGGDDTTCTMVCPASGKWYAEFAFVASGGGSCHFGVYDNSKSPVRIANGIQYRDDGPVYCNNSQIATYAAYTSSDTVAVAIDIAANLVYFYKNNTLQGSVNFVSVAGIATNNVIFGTRCNSGVSATANFGQRPFVYTPPSDFIALNTYNLPTPAIVRGNQYMDATTYTGDSNSRTVMNAGSFQPDFVWIKDRSVARSHRLIDSVRGTTKTIYTDLQYGEDPGSAIASFNSNGFTLNSSAADNQNINNESYVAWQWKAGGTAVSNTSGSITSSVSANTTSGFSIVTFNAGTGSSAQTVGHGLGVVPSLILFHDRTNAYYFYAYHSSVTTQNQYLTFSTTAAVGNQSGFWGSSLPTSSVFGFTCNNTVAGSANVVVYCFAPIAGFSAFGSYTGNGSTTGPFIYCGFQPKFVMRKRTDSTGNWIMQDTSRNPYNRSISSNGVSDTNVLYANDSIVETGYNEIAVLSNGFQVCANDSNGNASGGTFIYMAFASNPFRNSNAR